MPDEEELFEVLCRHLSGQGYEDVERQCASLCCKRDGKSYTIYIDIMEDE